MGPKHNASQLRTVVPSGRPSRRRLKRRRLLPRNTWCSLVGGRIFSAAVSKGARWAASSLTNRFSVCQTGGTTGGNGGCREVEIDQVFLGDCDDDSNVTVDEIVSLVAIALAARPASDCQLGDGNADQVVTVDEVTIAV